MQKLATAAVVALGLLAGPATTGYAQCRAPLRGPLTITRGTRPALQETHGTIIIRGMGTRTTTRRFRPPRRIGTPTSPSARIPTMPVRRPAVTAAPSVDYRCVAARAGKRPAEPQPLPSKLR
jgi:hypothetical protein